MLQDIFVANFGGVVNHLYLGDGSGGFSKVLSGEIATDSAYSCGAVMGDVNGDGHVVRLRDDVMRMGTSLSVVTWGWHKLGERPQWSCWPCGSSGGAAG